MLKTLLHFALFLALICFAISPMSRERCPRTMLVQGQGSTYLVTAAILWPRYEHIEYYVAVHYSAWIALLIHGFSPVNARLLITCDTAFYAIILLRLDTSYTLWSLHLCMVVNPVIFDSFASLFNCTTMGWSSD